jgi:two-component system LytT family response regulator
MTDINNRRIRIKTYRLICLINLDSIVYCFARGRFTNIATTDNEEVFTRHSLKELEGMIDEDFFIRCHKCLLVNMHYVKAYDSGNNELILVNDVKVKVSRGKVNLIRQYFKKHSLK